MSRTIPPLSNGKAFPLSKIPLFSMDSWQTNLLDAVGEGARVSALFALPSPKAQSHHLLLALLTKDKDGTLLITSTEVQNEFPSLTPNCPQVHRFEREIFETMGITPIGHPFLKPIRNPLALTKFFQVTGSQVHEVAVGPVHAGVIEPGHFRFQCYGEKIFHLEIDLGYQHRGIERALCGGPHPASVHLLETAAGDTSVGHALAYSLALEGLLEIEVPNRAHALRHAALELERLANHVGDLGALALDVGFLPTSAFCGRIRGDFLNLTAQICGSRLGRNWIRPGGCRFDLSDASIHTFVKKLKSAYSDAKQAIELLWESPSVMSRLEGVGVVSKKNCLDFGFVGPVARACGVKRDIRADFPFDHEAKFPFPTHTQTNGDVYARAMVRWLEIHESCRFLLSELPALQSGPVQTVTTAQKGVPRLPAHSIVVSLVEGWRGEICHVAITDTNGKFLKYKIVDPSFHNWTALELAMQDQEISDFPLCNKSFNLSYCGHDL